MDGVVEGSFVDVDWELENDSDDADVLYDVEE